MWTRTNPFQHWSTIDSQIDVEQDYFDIVSDKFYRAEENSFIHEHPELLEDWNYELNGNVNPQSWPKEPVPPVTRRIFPSNKFSFIQPPAAKLRIS